VEGDRATSPVVCGSRWGKLTFSVPRWCGGGIPPFLAVRWMLRDIACAMPKGQSIGRYVVQQLPLNLKQFTDLCHHEVILPIRFSFRQSHPPWQFPSILSSPPPAQFNNTRCQILIHPYNDPPCQLHTLPAPQIPAPCPLGVLLRASLIVPP
jgi:hypothetical protein